MKPNYAVLAVVAQTVFALGFVFTKFGLGHFPPVFLMGMRYTLTALVLIWFVRPPGGMWRQFILVGLTCVTIPHALIFSGLKDLNASLAILIVQLNVPFLAVAGWLLLGEKLGWRRFFGMLVAFAGVGLITGEPKVNENMLPVLLVIAGGVCWAFGQTRVRKLGAIKGVWLLAWVAAFSAPQFFILSAVIENGQWEAVTHAGWREWGVILYLGLVMTGFGYTLWFHLLGRCEVTQVAPFLLLKPVVAVVGSVLILTETVPLLVALGGILVVSGIGIMTVRRWPWSRTTLPATTGQRAAKGQVSE